MVEFEDIPDFLRLTAEERAAARMATPVTRVSATKAKLTWSLPKTLESEGKQMIRDKAKEQRKKDRARLRELAQRRKKV